METIIMGNICIIGYLLGLYGIMEKKMETTISVCCMVGSDGFLKVV